MSALVVVLGEGWARKRLLTIVIEVIWHRVEQGLWTQANALDIAYAQLVHLNILPRSCEMGRLLRDPFVVLSLVRSPGLAIVASRPIGLLFTRVLLSADWYFGWLVVGDLVDGDVREEQISRPIIQAEHIWIFELPAHPSDPRVACNLQPQRLCQLNKYGLCIQRLLKFLVDAHVVKQGPDDMDEDGVYDGNPVDDRLCAFAGTLQ